MAGWRRAWGSSAGGLDEKGGASVPSRPRDVIAYSWRTVATRRRRLPASVVWQQLNRQWRNVSVEPFRCWRWPRSALLRRDHGAMRFLHRPASGPIDSFCEGLSDESQRAVVQYCRAATRFDT